MSVENNKAVVKRWNEEIASSDNLDAFGEVLAENYTIYMSGTDSPWAPFKAGLGPAKAEFGALRKRFPGLKASVEAIVGEGDFVAARLVHTSQGKPVLAGISIYRLVDGKIMDDWYAGTQIET